MRPIRLSRPRLAIIVVVALVVGAIIGTAATASNKAKTATPAAMPTTTITATETANIIVDHTVMPPVRTIVKTVQAAAPTPPPPAAIPGLSGDQALLKVTSNGSSATITYTEDGSIEQATNASLPWQKVVTRGDFVSLSAQDDDGTTITCQILNYDGTIASQHTATGAYAIASCDNS